MLSGNTSRRGLAMSGQKPSAIRTRSSSWWRWAAAGGTPGSPRPTTTPTGQEASTMTDHRADNAVIGPIGIPQVSDLARSHSSNGKPMSILYHSSHSVAALSVAVALAVLGGGAAQAQVAAQAAPTEVGVVTLH